MDYQKELEKAIKGIPNLRKLQKLITKLGCDLPDWSDETKEAAVRLEKMIEEESWGEGD